MVNNSDDRKRKRVDDLPDMNKILKIVQPIASRYMTQFSAISNGVPSFPPTIYSYVSPSNLYHFARDDPFQDVLNKFPDYFINLFDGKITPHPDPTVAQLFEQGNTFEEKVKDLLEYDYGYTVTSLPKPHIKDGVDDSIVYQMTLDALNSGVDIIYQGCFFNSDMGIYGHPDFLIRADLVNQLCINNNYPDEFVDMPSRFGNHHYVVFDTKFHTLNMKSDVNKGMLNNDSEKYYKIQLYMYSKCLEYIQGTCPAFAYVIGRGFKSERIENKIKISERSNHIFDRMGHIDIHNIEIETEKRNLSIPEWVEGGVEWIHTLRALNNQILDTINWENPSETYFRPNMNNKRATSATIDNIVVDTSPIRRKLAIMQGEPTLLANVTTDNRNKLHENGVYSIFDERCTAELMGYKDVREKRDENRKIMKDKKGNKLMEPNMRCVNINIRIKQFRDADNVMPDIYGRHISNTKINKIHEQKQELGNRDLLRNFKNNGYIVMDFENRVCISDNFEKLPESDHNTVSYLIGLSHVSNDTSVNFNQIIADRLDEASEYKLCRELINYMTPHMNKTNPTKILIWSKAEYGFIKKLKRNHLALLSDDDLRIFEAIHDNMVDMCEFFEKEKIIIKGCYTLSLKDVARNLHRLGIISTIWDAESSGIGLLNGIDLINDEVVLTNTHINDHPDFDRILKYNYVDCQVIVEIVNWLYGRTSFYTNQEIVKLS
jgi:hypothetical protein